MDANTRIKLAALRSIISVHNQELSEIRRSEAASPGQRYDKEARGALYGRTVKRRELAGITEEIEDLYNEVC